MSQPSGGRATVEVSARGWAPALARLRRAEVWWVAGLIALGALVRLGLLLAGWPATDSDEGTMGLMALHINALGERPLFFYGQSYMGTIQAYLGAALFHIFGPSVFALRLGLLLLFIPFLLVIYLLLRLLYGSTYALFGLLLLDLGGPELLRPELLALGGYPETLLFGALSLLLALLLARGAGSEPLAWRAWRRLLLYGALGLVMGLGWWSDQLIFPLLLAAAALLAIFARRELRWRGLLTLGAGLLIGLLPQLLYLLHPTTITGPTAVSALEWEGPGTLLRLPITLGAHLAGALLVSLPDITGMGWACPAPTISTGALVAPTSAGAIACLALRWAWSLGLLALGVVAGLLAWRALPSWRTLWRAAPAWSGDERAEAARQCGRLALLVGAALTLLFFTISLAALTPGQHTRYLIEVDMALPALLYPLWARVGDARLGARLAAFVAPRTRWPRLAGLGLVVALLVGGVAASYQQSAVTSAHLRAGQDLAADLEALGVRHMYTDYWTCDKLAFLSRERITCVALAPTLALDSYNRYPPYLTLVKADSRTAYVFRAQSPQARLLAARAGDSAWPYTLTMVDGYAVWLPHAP